MLTLLLGLNACSTSPRRFTAPSTASVHTQIAETRSNIGSAKTKATQVKETIEKAKDLGKGNQALELQLDNASTQIDALTADLMKADNSASEAESKLVEADGKITKLTADANKVSAERDKYKEFYDSGHKFWGIGGIFQGFAILAEHLLVMVGFLILLALLFFVASIFIPALGPIVAIGTGFFSNLWHKILRK